jgi:hypothetical protein
MLLGRRRGLRRTLPQDELNAQKLRNAPALLVALGSSQRFVDYREPFGRSIVTTLGVRNLGEKWSEKHAKRVLKDAGERGAQKLLPGANIAALDEQYASETSTPEVPQLHRVPGGKIHERLYVALRQDQVAGENATGQADRSRALASDHIADASVDYLNARRI